MKKNPFNSALLSKIKESSLKFVIPSFMAIFSFLIFSSLVLTSCEKQKVEPIAVDYKYQGDKKAEALVTSGNEFGLDLFKRIATASDCPDNMMMSPVSVAMALGMTYNGANGETKTAFEETLRLEGFSREEINEIHQALIEYLLKADPKVVLEIANSIWYRYGFNVLETFIDINRKHYFAEVRGLDFARPDAVKTINDWCAVKTHDKIKDVLDEIPANAVMYLINALYFNGIWKYEFDPDKSFDGSFFDEEENEISVKYIKNEGSFNYFGNSIFSAVELPYGNGNFVMDILLPNPGKTLSDIYANLTSANWESWISSFTISQAITVQIPKFKYEYKTELNDPLMDMGLSPAFIPGQADFSGINPDAELSISRVIHKTFIDVNEKGTEAAAVTVVEIRLTSAGPDASSFIADRPFVYAIREKVSGALLFMGKVENPVYK